RPHVRGARPTAAGRPRPPARPHPRPDLPGSIAMTATIVITGATTGLGRQIARSLARRGDRIFAVGRDPARAATLQAELRARSDVGSIAAAIALATAAGEQTFAELVRRHTDHVDALVNNAGVMSPHRQETTDGYEL